MARKTGILDYVDIEEYDTWQKRQKAAKAEAAKKPVMPNPAWRAAQQMIPVPPEEQEGFAQFRAMRQRGIV